ncbi:Conserved oligomeric Golgi complex subunit 3 [Smittium culicis]|uniref:Conserved oligomeric Golgi complex subunit 3 n=1 Tax=Smittium culicis TaxID=133412 RepID=A0A1R1XIR7_9FUNG|nr:Conserved oligomeric Golgi complex subunit 3 [Smittium culicis]
MSSKPSFSSATNEVWEKQISLDLPLFESISAIQLTSSPSSSFKPNISLKFDLLSPSLNLSPKSAPIPNSISKNQQSIHFKAPQSNSSQAPIPEADLSPFSLSNLKIHSTGQFLEWFEKLESHISQQQNAEIDSMKADFLQKSNICSQTLEISNQVLDSINVFKKYYAYTKQKEAIFLNTILPQKLELSDKNLLHLGLSQGLYVFKCLDEITRLFNSPGDNVCYDHHFLPYLNKTDFCIDFLKKNRYSRDAELYLLRFHQAQARALTLIKMLFFNRIKLLLPPSSQIPTLISSTASFINASIFLKPFILEIESRLGSVKEANSLILSLHKYYFNVRKQIVYPFVSKDLDHITASLKQNISNILLSRASSSPSSHSPHPDLELQSPTQEILPQSSQLSSSTTNLTSNADSSFNNISDFDSLPYNTFNTFSLINQLFTKSGTPPNSEIVDFHSLFIQAEILHSWCSYTTELSSNEYNLAKRFFNLNIKGFDDNQSLSPNIKPSSTELPPDSFDYDETSIVNSQSNLRSLALSVFAPEPNNLLFSQLSHGLVTFLESFLSLLYDRIRPLIISEHKILALSIYCLVLRSFGWTSSKYKNFSSLKLNSNTSRINLNSDLADKPPIYSDSKIHFNTYDLENSKKSFESNDDSFEFSIIQNSNYDKKLSLDLCMSTFYSIIDILLGDASHRLVFRSQAFVDLYISNYTLSDFDFIDIKNWLDKVQEYFAINSDQTTTISDEITSKLPPPNSDPSVSGSLDSTFLDFCNNCPTRLSIPVFKNLYSETLSSCKSNISSKSSKAVAEKFPNTPLAHYFTYFSIYSLNTICNNMFGDILN